MVHRHQLVADPNPEGRSGPRCRGTPVGVVFKPPRLRPLAVAFAQRTVKRPPVMIGEPCELRFAIAKAEVHGPSPGDTVVLPKDLGEVWHCHARRDLLDLRPILTQVRLARQSKDVLLLRRAVALATQRVAQEREALIDVGDLGLLRREGECQMLVQKGRYLGLHLFKLRFGPLP